MKKFLLPIIFLAALTCAAPSVAGPPVEILGSATPKFIGGQNVVFKAYIVFNQQINPFWEDLKKIDLSPFTIEKMTVGERKIFTREKELVRDYREITFMLSLPESSKCGAYSIPSFQIGYSYLSGKNEVRNTVKSKAVKTEKVPLLISLELEKDTVTIGEINTLVLTIVKENSIRILNYDLRDQLNETDELKKEGFTRWLKSLEARDQKITDLNKPDFAPFKLLSAGMKTEVRKSVSAEIFEYKLAFYELGGKEFKIPAFHIWHIDTSGGGKAEPKETVLASPGVLVNLIVNPQRKQIEWLKPPAPTPSEYIYYFGYAPMALGGLGFIVFAAILAVNLIRRTKPTEDEEIYCEQLGMIKRSLEELLKVKDVNPKTLKQIRNEFFKLLGGQMGISITLAMSKTSSQMVKEAPVKDAEELKRCLNQMDRAISGEGGNTEEALEYIRKTAKMPLNKKKKIRI